MGFREISCPKSGDQYRDDNQKVLEKTVDLKEIKKMRRYMQIGIN